MCTSSAVQESDLSVWRFCEDEFFVAGERAPFGLFYYWTEGDGPGKSQLNAGIGDAPSNLSSGFHTRTVSSISGRLIVSGIQPLACRNTFTQLTANRMPGPR